MAASRLNQSTAISSLRQQIAELQHELVVARQLSSAFFDRALAMLCTVGFDGYFTHLNPMWSQVLGFSEEELRAKPFLSFVHPDDAALTAAAARQLGNENPEVISFENRYRCKDGSYRWLRWYATPDSERGLIYAVVQEITTARADEEQLRIYEQFFQHTPTGQFVLQLEQPDDPAAMRMISANPAACAAAGVAIEDVVGRTFSEIFSADLTERLAPIFATLAREGGTRNFGEMRFPGPRASERVLIVQALALPGRKVAVTFEDVTARAQAEAAAELQLRRSEARFRDIALNIPGAVFQFAVRDGIWTVDFISERIAAIAGVSAAEVMDDIHVLVARIHSDDREHYLTSVTEAVEQGASWHYQGRFVLPDGQVRWWQGDSNPVINDAGNVIFNGVVVDLTAQRQAEEALRQNLVQEEIIRAQRAALEELSTPLIPITDSIVVMPLIGSVDSRRAQQVIETLLEGIAQTRAEVTILDITGVPVVDTQVANAFVRAAQAVKLLGAQVMITGIRPEVAQTLVGLGVDLSGIKTHSTLQAGIAQALR